MQQSTPIVGSKTSFDKSKDVPFVTITEDGGRVAISTNIPPTAKPAVLWLIEQAKLMILMNPSEEEKSKIHKPNNGNGLGWLKNKISC